MQLDIEKERAIFEATIIANAPSYLRDQWASELPSLRTFDGYNKNFLHDQFKGWIAAKRDSLPNAPKSSS